MANMKLALDSALDCLGMRRGRERGMYAPLARRYPVRTGDEIPLFVEQNLAANHTCACTDGRAVYIDADKAEDMFTNARKDSGREDEVTDRIAKENYETLLVHEYTHILMRHVEKGVKFVTANGKKNYPIFALACDIEANRGYGIERCSDIYQIAVSEDSYPECKGIVGLMNIYRTLKKHYGEEILEDYEAMKKCVSDEDGSEGEGGKEEEKLTTTQKRIKSNIRQYEEMAEEIEKLSSSMSEEEKNEGSSQYMDTPKSESMGSGNSNQPIDPTLDSNPDHVVKVLYEASIKRDVDKAMERLKGLVKGSQIKSRTSTYSRPSRRGSVDGLIRKGVKNKKALAPRILVAMDSSGSMCKTEVTPVAQAVGSIAQTLGKTKGSFICEHDGRVRNVQPLSKWEEVVKGYYPLGDNCFDDVLQKAIELKVEVVLNVGDGYCKFHNEWLMKKAKQLGIKWFDVQVCGEEGLLRQLIDEDAKQYGENFMGREVIKVGQDSN